MKRGDQKIGGSNLKGNNLAMLPNQFSFKFNLFHLGAAPAGAGRAVPR